MIFSAGFLIGYLAGGVTALVGAFSLWFAVDFRLIRFRRRRSRPLPPATVAQLRRARRANRLELRTRDSHWVVPARDNFDTEDTQ